MDIYQQAQRDVEEKKKAIELYKNRKIDLDDKIEKLKKE